MLDARDGEASGLERIDGKLVHQNDMMTRGDIFPEKAEQTIVCSVRKGRILVTVKGKPLIDWNGDFTRLSGHTGVREKRGLYLGNSLPVYQIRQLVRADPARTDAARRSRFNRGCGSCHHHPSRS